MLFRFIGNDDSDPGTISLFGYEFTKNGEPVDVSGEYEIGKLNGNSHFEKVDGRTITVKPDPNTPLEDMKAGALREVAKERGVTFKFGATKADMLEALNVGD